MKILSVNKIPGHHMITGHRCFAGGCDGLIEYRVQVSLPAGEVNLCLCDGCKTDVCAHPDIFMQTRLGVDTSAE